MYCHQNEARGDHVTVTVADCGGIADQFGSLLTLKLRTIEHQVQVYGFL